MKTELSAVANQINQYLDTHQLDHISPKYLATAATYLVKNGGKRIRPALLCWFAQAHGTSIDKVIPVAAATEIYHTWTLVHDDIIDNDDTRRGNPATHTHLMNHAVKQFGSDNRFGVSMGILTGDLQQAWVNKLVLNGLETSCKPETILAIIDRINSYLTPKLIDGEATDVEFESRSPKNVEEVIQMMENKTGVLLEFSAQTGVLLAKDGSDYSDSNVIEAGSFAKNCGLAFQLQDDILGIFADESKLGKPVGSDLCCGKQTVLMLKTKEKASKEEISFLNSLTEKELLNSKELSKAQEIIRDCGALKEVQNMAKKFTDSALKSLQSFPKNQYRDYLEQFCHYMTNREK